MAIIWAWACWATCAAWAAPRPSLIASCIAICPVAASVPSAWSWASTASRMASADGGCIAFPGLISKSGFRANRCDSRISMFVPRMFASTRNELSPRA